MKTKTCLRYPGGKFYGAKLILPLFDSTHTEYREPFIGGASIFLAKPKAEKINWINDKDEELINFYHIIQESSDAEKLYDLLKNEYVDKSRYSEILELKPKSDLIRAFKYFYLNRTSFSGIMNKPRWGYRIGSSVTPDRWVERIKPVAEKLKNVKITCSDFRDVLCSGNDNVLCYIDPPYYVAAKGIYSKSFDEKDHQDLCDILKNAKFKFVLSYENSPIINEMYRWANIKTESWVYYMSEERRTDGKELIISNY